MTTEHRYMDVAEFRRLGYLQEVNRRLLYAVSSPGRPRIDEELDGRYHARHELLGFFTQPTATEEWHIHTDETAPASAANAAGAQTENGARP